MKKAIIIIVVLAILIAGGWYLYSQQNTGQEQAKTPEDSDISIENDTPPGEEGTLHESEEEDSEEDGEEEEEADRDNPYYEKDEVPAIAGPNKEIHEISERILTSVFDEVKLTNTDSTDDPDDPKFGYLADYNYIVPEKIDMDQAGQVREAILEEGGEINSTDVGSKSYKYEYNFEMDEKEYSANMNIFVGEEKKLGDNPQTIELDVRLES